MAKKFPQLSAILKRLIFQKNIKPTDLARKLNIPQPTIHRIVTGKSTRPYLSSLKPIAEYFSLNVNQLIGEEPLPAEFSENNAKQNIFSGKIQYLPLIPWEQLSNNNSDYEKIPFLGSISIQGFATTMPDSSMEPLFPSGSVLIFDPNKIPKDRSYVIVQLSDSNMFVFRQLLIDLDHKYIKPLNPDLNTFKMHLLGKNDRIYAVLVEARRMYEEL
jgi:SOS-response transcriptional repressor LexA